MSNTQLILRQFMAYFLAIRDVYGEQDLLRSHNCLPVTCEEAIVHLNHTTAIC